MLRLWVLSDLHLENSDWAPNQNHGTPDMVVLAGDIAEGTDGVVWAGAQFDCPVLYVPGNHEYYGHDILRLPREMRAAAPRAVTVLDRDVAEIHKSGRKYRFVGCTLWTDFQAALGQGVSREQAMRMTARHFSDVERITVDDRAPMGEDILSWHRRDLGFLRDQLSAPYDGTTIVVTHHAPSLGSRNIDYPMDGLMTYFLSDLEETVRSFQPDFWIHGHTHHSVDYQIGSTRVLSNQRGRPKHSAATARSDTWTPGTFRPLFTVELP